MEYNMTMHLVRGMTSLNSKKRKTNRKPGWEAAQAKHDAWLRKMGAHPTQIKQQKKEKKPYVPSINPTTRRSTIPTSDVIPGACLKRSSNQYTGTLIKGIGQMHKSNAVPISSKAAAEEIARMRRG